MRWFPRHKSGWGSFSGLVVLLSVLLWGCSSGPKVEVSKFFREPACEVAVFPILNESRREGAGKLLGRVLVNEMVKEGIRVYEEGVVRRFLERQRCLPGRYISSEVIRLFGKETGVKLVIEGVVTQALELGEDAVLSFFLWARDTESGNIVWAAYYSKRGTDYRKVFHFGKTSSLSILASKMVRDLVERLKKEKVVRCRSS